MKLSRPSWALILIVSGLLLSQFIRKRAQKAKANVNLLDRNKQIILPNEDSQNLDYHCTNKEGGSHPESSINQTKTSASDRAEGSNSKNPTNWYCQLPPAKKIEFWSMVLVAISTVVMAVFTGFLWYTSTQQLGAMEKQLAEMVKGGTDTKTIAESAKTQADSAKKLAEATEIMAEATRSSVAQSKASLDATIEMGHLEQRAWVAMKQMNATFKDDTTIRVSITFVNSGKTPAFNVNLGVGPFIRPPGIMTGTDKRIRRTNHQAIFPNGPPSIEILGIYSSREEVDAIKTGKKVLLVIGEIEYRDVFSKPHITEFCGIYGPNDGLFYACNEHQRAT